MTNRRKEHGLIFAIRRRAICGALAIATVLLLAGLVTRPAQAVQAQAQPNAPTYTILCFTGGYTEAGLIGDAAGNLYGTTSWGGNPGCSMDYGCGVVFKVDPAGNETVLYSFTGGADGGVPNGSLIRDSAGNLYGMTSEAGDLSCDYYGHGCGVVFKLDPAGRETVLHTFTGADGANPYRSGLIRDAAGNLYGMTSVGGDLSCGYYGDGCGVVFKLDPAGSETVLHIFTGADGANPYGNLIRDAVGNLYGTTSLGGSGTGCERGCGVAFKVDPAGKETVLHSFTGGAADGAYPYAGLVRDPAGNLYGTTNQGGGGFLCAYPEGGCGVVFKLDPAGKETVLHRFRAGRDGVYPQASLIRDPQGNLYGTTSGGNGAVFVVGPNGTEKVLYYFTGSEGDRIPYSPLLPYKGALYGTLSSGFVFTLTLR